MLFASIGEMGVDLFLLDNSIIQLQLKKLLQLIFSYYSHSKHYNYKGKKMNEEIKEDRFQTIREIFDKYLDNPNIQTFGFRYNGQLYAANHKTKRPCRVSISIPKTICDTNLKDLDNWIIMGVAIPRDEIKD